MSSGMAMLITSACLSVSNIHKEACNKALEAGSKQSGIEQNVELIQSNVEREANKKAYYLLGQTGVEMVGGGIFIAKTVREKAVDFNLPTLGICDRITNRVGSDKYFLELVWVLK